MKRLLIPTATIAASVALAACGGGSSSGGTSTTAGSDTVSVQQLSGVGSVLVDQSGKALYSSDQEASGKIICAETCTAFWKPLAPGAGGPTAASGAGKLAVISRPDGSKQVTANGKPLYTFSEDSPGKATGNGFTDDFSGHHFTWHVVQPGGKTAAGASGGGSSSSSRGGYGGY